MTLLSKALQVSFRSKARDDYSYYDCNLDSNWAVFAVPQGGYTIGVIIEACIQHQSNTSHVDPIYISAHFLRATTPGPGQVRVKLLKSGKTFTNVLAEFLQQETTRITAHLVFGDLSPLQPGQGKMVLAPPSPYARRVPLYLHPSIASYDAVKPPWARPMEFHMSTDPVLWARNDPGSATRTTPESIGGGGVEWGAWCELAHKDDKITATSIPFFCDASTSLPDLLPKSEPGSSKGEKSWFPTIAMTIEFKAKIPSSTDYAVRTIGVYSESRFQTDPNGRHNMRVEVWTAPCEIGQGEATEGWREKQFCIAVADQMALSLPSQLMVRKDPVKL